jgi:hypothetical protein
MLFHIATPARSDYASPLAAHLDYSPSACVKIVDALGGPAIIQVFFVDGAGSSLSCYVVLDGTESVGSYLFAPFAESASFTTPRYYFPVKWGGLRQVVNATVVSGTSGDIAIQGFLGRMDSFEERDWTLTLTI